MSYVAVNQVDAEEMDSNNPATILKNYGPRIMKLGFYGLLLLSVATLTISQNIYTHQADNRNNSLETLNCPSRFPLSDRLVASVCYDDGDNVIVDIRLFILDKPNIKGIALTEDKYFALDHLYDSILFAVRELRDGA